MQNEVKLLAMDTSVMVNSHHESLFKSLGNLHLNICTPQFDKSVFADIEPYIYEWTASKRGSISAEHGLGVMKPEFLHFSKPRPVVDIMRKMKYILDPNGILNPYKVLPK